MPRFYATGGIDGLRTSCYYITHRRDETAEFRSGDTKRGHAASSGKGDNPACTDLGCKQSAAPIRLIANLLHQTIVSQALPGFCVRDTVSVRTGQFNKEDPLQFLRPDNNVRTGACCKNIWREDQTGGLKIYQQAPIPCTR